ncbi:MAG: ParB/RepB/Spo0J family partition protein [Pseudomonadota bacterium]
MSAKRRGLGRGLDALLGDAATRKTPLASEGGDVPATATTPPAAEAEPGERVEQLGVERLQRGEYQPRSDMRKESLEELAASIGKQGIMQPIVARPVGGKGAKAKYEIIAGERRWRAAQLAGLSKVPVIIREVPDETALAMALIENIQRENLNPLEEARALIRLVDEFGLTHAEAAEAVSRSRAAVSNLLRLLDLDDAVKERLERRELEMGHARALLPLAGREQARVAAQVVEGRLSVRQTEQLVRQVQKAAAAAEAGAKADEHEGDRDIARLEERLSEQLGAAVKIRHSAKGKGSVSIAYNSLDELEGILDHIK